MATKATLRKLLLQMRQELPLPAAQEKSNQICSQFFAEFDLSAVNWLHVFLPVQEKSEVNTWPVIHRIWQDFPHIKLAVPVTPPGSEVLVHRQLTPETTLLKSKWGIEEPNEASPLVREQEIDLALVPLLAFDLRGHRVGYGKGFYDRFLRTCRPDVRTVGLSLFPPVDEIADVNEFDQPLQFCLTPERVYRF